VPRRERHFLGRTKEFDLLALDNHDLPEAVGFVESDRGYVVPGFVEHFGAIPHRAHALSFMNSIFLQPLRALQIAGRWQGKDAEQWL
jgi:hypothetical protein